jgi:hypothetical protein
MKALIAALALVTLIASPTFAQTNGDRMSAGRAAAMRECNRQAAKYPEYVWGDFEINVYRACMTERGQQE